MVDVWQPPETMPPFARLDYWVGGGMAFYAILAAMADMMWLSLLFLCLQVLFMKGLKLPYYLFESYDSEGEGTDRELKRLCTGIENPHIWIVLRCFDIISGPYFGDELAALKADIGRDMARRM